MTTAGRITLQGAVVDTCFAAGSKEDFGTDSSRDQLLASASVHKLLLMVLSKQRSAARRLPSLAIALALLGGCASEPKPVDPRPPAMSAAPTPAEWRAVAGEIASEIAAARASRSDRPPVSLAPLGGGPAYLYDILLAELVVAGVPVATQGATPAAVVCRVSTTGTSRPPRGAISTAPDPTAETVLLCLLAENGRYVAASRRILRLHPVENGPYGVVLEITG